MSSTDPVSSITNCYSLIVSYTDPVHSQLDLVQVELANTTSVAAKTYSVAAKTNLVKEVKAKKTEGSNFPPCYCTL